MTAPVLTPTAQQQAILDAAASNRPLAAGDDVKILTSSPHSLTTGVQEPES